MTQVRVDFIVAGAVEQFGAIARANFTRALAVEVGLVPSDDMSSAMIELAMQHIKLTISSASIRILAEILVASNASSEDSGVEKKLVALAENVTRASAALGVPLEAMSWLGTSSVNVFVALDADGHMSLTSRGRMRDTALPAAIGTTAAIVFLVLAALLAERYWHIRSTPLSLNKPKKLIEVKPKKLIEVRTDGRQESLVFQRA
jgi:hypothetical protein